MSSWLMKSKKVKDAKQRLSIHMGAADAAAVADAAKSGDGGKKASTAAAGGKASGGASALDSSLLLSSMTSLFDPYSMKIESDKFPGEVPVFIEVSKESRNKYEWDHELGAMCLDRVLHSAVHYPDDYGFIPRTLCGDGDPLDVLVVGTSPLIPGCVVRVRVLAYMEMTDEKGPDEKVLAVIAKDPHFAEWKKFEDIPQHKLKEIAHFFETYKALEKGKWAKVGGWKGTQETYDLIKKTNANFEAKYRAEST